MSHRGNLLLRLVSLISKPFCFLIDAFLPSCFLPSLNSFSHQLCGRPCIKVSAPDTFSVTNRAIFVNKSSGISQTWLQILGLY